MRTETCSDMQSLKSRVLGQLEKKQQEAREARRAKQKEVDERLRQATEKLLEAEEK